MWHTFGQVARNTSSLCLEVPWHNLTTDTSCEIDTHTHTQIKKTQPPHPKTKTKTHTHTHTKTHVIFLAHRGTSNFTKTLHPVLAADSFSIYSRLRETVFLSRNHEAWGTKAREKRGRGVNEGPSDSDEDPFVMKVAGHQHPESCPPQVHGQLSWMCSGNVKADREATRQQFMANVKKNRVHAWNRQNGYKLSNSAGWFQSPVKLLTKNKRKTRWETIPVFRPRFLRSFHELLTKDHPSFKTRLVRFLGQSWHYIC